MDQQRALCEVEDVDLRHKFEEEVHTLSPGLMSENPLHMDNFFLAGVEMIIGIDH